MEGTLNIIYNMSTDSIHGSNEKLKQLGQLLYTDTSGRDIYDSYDGGYLPEVEVQALALPNKKSIAYEMQKRRN